MLLAGFTLEIFKSKCDAKAQGVHCFVHLSDNISKVLPLLNTRLGGFVYTVDPPSLTLKNHGKLITLHPWKIAINALRDRSEAEKIAGWLHREINENWENRHDIRPSTQSARQPLLIEVLKLLPKTNCKECRDSTCMVFATRVVEGVKNANDCPQITPENKKKLSAYLAEFAFD